LAKWLGINPHFKEGMVDLALSQKTSKKATNGLLTQAPSSVSLEQLRELGIRLKRKM